MSALILREVIETVPSMVWSAAPDGEPTLINKDTRLQRIAP
jgi:hypothetical protein